MTDQNIDQTPSVPPPPPDFQLPKYPSGLLTLREAASLLRVHPNTLRNWEEQGRVSSVRIGARHLGDHPKPANEGRLKTGQRS